MSAAEADIEPTLLLVAKQTHFSHLESVYTAFDSLKASPPPPWATSNPCPTAPSLPAPSAPSSPSAPTPPTSHSSPPPDPHSGTSSPQPPAPTAPRPSPQEGRSQRAWTSTCAPVQPRSLPARGACGEPRRARSSCALRGRERLWRERRGERRRSGPSRRGSVRSLVREKSAGGLRGSENDEAHLPDRLEANVSSSLLSSAPSRPARLLCGLLPAPAGLGSDFASFCGGGVVSDG